MKEKNIGTLTKFFRRYKPYIIILPALALTIGILVPFGTGVVWSFTNYNLMRPGFSFTGFENYISIFTSDAFWHAVYVTFLYVLGAVGTETVLGLIIALLLNQETIMAKLLRPFLILPLLIAPVIATLMWKLMMSTQYGVLNYFMSGINPALRDFPWAGSADWAMFSAVVIDVWIFTPFIALLLLAGLRSLPQPPFEAAKVDGASNWFTFKNITMPMLVPYLAIAIIFRLVDSIRMFAIPYGLTQGGPGNALMNLQVSAYKEAFSYMNIAKGSGYMFLTWIIIFIVSNYMVSYWQTARAKMS